MSPYAQGDSLSIQPFSKLKLDKVYTLISNPSSSRSMMELKNSIKVYTGNEDYSKVVATEKDNTLIKRYDLLQQVDQVDDGNIVQARNIRI